MAEANSEKLYSHAQLAKLLNHPNSRAFSTASIALFTPSFLYTSDVWALMVGVSAL